MIVDGSVYWINMQLKSCSVDIHEKHPVPVLLITSASHESKIVEDITDTCNTIRGSENFTDTGHWVGEHVAG